jgi:predicted DNA-binding protein
MDPTPETRPKSPRSPRVTGQTAQIAVRLPLADEAALRALAAATGRTQADIVREAVHQAVSA